MSDTYGQFVAYRLSGPLAASVSTGFVRTPVLTVGGNAAVDSQGRISLDGSGDYLRLPPVTFGTADCCIDAFVTLSALPASDDWPGSWSSLMSVAGVGTAGVGDGYELLLGSTQIMCQSNDAKLAAGTHGMSTGTRYHIAVSRVGNTVTTYVAGQSKGSSTVSGSLGTGAFTWIGCETGEGAWLNGTLEVRITIGHGRYTGNFTPPTEFDEVDVAISRLETGCRTHKRFAGRGVISGTVTEDHVAGAYPVRLFHRGSGLLVDETTSATDGSYQFDRLQMLQRGYFVLAHDIDSPWRNAAVADLVTPE